MPDAALERFLDGVQGRAVQMATFALSDRDAALDVVQDAMLAWLSRYGNRPSQEWAPLFWRVLQNRIRDRWRRRQVQRRLFSWLGLGNDAGAEAVETLADLSGGADPARQLDDERFRAALHSALRELPLRQQQAFLLRHIEGLDTAATAHALGIREGSVKSHLHRAVQHLQQRLEAYR